MIDTKIRNFGECKYPNPANYEFYTKDTACVMVQSVFETPESCQEIIARPEKPLFFEQAGPREKIFFNSTKVTAGIVTCGGLSPGINDVIRALVMELHYRYKVPRILGFPYGYAGLAKHLGHHPIELTPQKVSNIVREGGTILGSSRGHQDPKDVVDTLFLYGVNMLFCIGGDGTLRGAHAIAEDILHRNIPISVIGIPKTIDNDINYVQKTFGFSSAFSKAVEAVDSANREALAYPNGIGLVKLMGRHSGFIAFNAALASKTVNYCLIPEKDFDLHGEGAFLPILKDRLSKRGHAVVIVAEGAGQKFLQKGPSETDASGNKKLQDIGIYLRDEINRYFHEEKIEVNVKYIDPSYMIRSIPANAEDSVYCGFLAQNAVHAAMCGKTDALVGLWNNAYTYIPINVAISERKVLKVENSSLWRALLASTGQPNSLLAKQNTSP